MRATHLMDQCGCALVIPAYETDAALGHGLACFESMSPRAVTIELPCPSLTWSSRATPRQVDLDAVSTAGSPTPRFAWVGLGWCSWHSVPRTNEASAWVIARGDADCPTPVRWPVYRRLVSIRLAAVVTFVQRSSARCARAGSRGGRGGRGGRHGYRLAIAGS